MEPSNDRHFLANSSRWFSLTRVWSSFFKLFDIFNIFTGDCPASCVNFTLFWERSSHWELHTQTGELLRSFTEDSPSISLSEFLRAFWYLLKFPSNSSFDLTLIFPLIAPFTLILYALPLIAFKLMPVCAPFPLLPNWLSFQADAVCIDAGVRCLH